MISLSEKVTIPSPAEEVWPLLRDPALVASCIPGATLVAEFAGNMARELERRRAPVAAAELPAAPEAAVAELRGGRLLWRAFLGWLRQILFTTRQRGSR